MTQTFIEDIRAIIINEKHAIYGNDIRHGFDIYFNATKPTFIENKWTVDYSEPAWHEVTDYNYHKILFPSFPEPVATTKDYLNFAQLKEGSVVLDLGAYSGLSSILFKEEVGDSGVVIAVEADVQCLDALKQNLELYKKHTGKDVFILFGAVWNHNKGLNFSSEGNMGSSAIECVGYGRGNTQFVESFTLSDIAKKFNLSKVDFIKCDIEGAEKCIFEDQEFFSQFQPRMIIEPHGPQSLFDKIFSDLAKYNYKCKVVKQVGVDVPLIECVV